MDSKIFDPINNYVVLAYAYLTAFVLYIRTFRNGLGRASDKFGEVVQIASVVSKQVEEVLKVSSEVILNPEFQEQLQHTITVFKDKYASGQF